MFHIKNLKISVEGKPIVDGVSLEIRPGEIHAIMGPNGSGKSTLANAIMGHPKYTITEGEIRMDKVAQPWLGINEVASLRLGLSENLISLKADKRARAGLFLAFQYPKEIPGVTVSSFLQMAVASVRKARGLSPRSPIEFRKLLREKLGEFSLDSKFMNRYMNEGFSGGEKKKMEILQMALLEPRMAILDETDSGLDVDALKIVAEGIKKLATPRPSRSEAKRLMSPKGESNERGVLLITHYQRILHYVTPHFVHVMMEGKLVKSGGPELAQRLEKEGYEWIKI